MGQICHHYGWTLDYLLWEIDWRIVQRMLIDTPSYDSEKKEGKEVIKYEEQTAEELEELFNMYEHKSRGFIFRCWNRNERMA